VESGFTSAIRFKQIALAYPRYAALNLERNFDEQDLAADGRSDDPGL